jgi:hypothetical protein
MSAGLGALAPYTDELRELLRRIATQESGAMSSAAANLDGRASAEFRRLVPLADRRQAGTFFTGSALRARALSRYRSSIVAGVHVVDPACGLGDLLLAAADLIPSGWSPARRTEHARAALYGRDLYRPLVDTATSRLALWSAVAGSPSSAAAWPVEVGDALGDDVDWQRFGLVLLNPPYATQRLQEAADWGSGRVTAAAPFTLEVVARARRGARIAAVLPDVLRCGARYGKWRDAIDKLADVEDLDVVGPFDRWTDVDVFVAHLRRRGKRQEPARPKSTWQPPSARGTTAVLSDVATLAVGDVVPHRDVPAGDASPYLTVDGLPAWTTTLETPQRVRHDGRLHEPPFVTLRRTSGPTRTQGAVRARAAVYAGPGPVAVENHLIVVRPLDGTVASCMRLMDIFRSSETTTWLDERLRLRHLTVTTLRMMPVRGFGSRAGSG